MFDSLGDRLFLLDLALLRTAPLALKRKVYAKGRWLLTRWFARWEPFNTLPARNEYFLRRFAEFTANGSPRPTVKFLHMMMTHLPIVLDEQCRFERRTMIRAHFKAQARCAVDAFLGVIAALRRAEVFDNSLIVLIADTGTRRIGHSAVESRIRETPFANLAGSANPVLLVKLPGARGPFTVNPAPVQVSDLPATVCKAMPDCREFSGKSVFEWHAGDSRMRRFNHYEWQHEFWGLPRIPGVTRYEVRGPLKDARSWSLEGGAPLPPTAFERTR